MALFTVSPFGHYQMQKSAQDSSQLAIQTNNKEFFLHIILDLRDLYVLFKWPMFHMPHTTDAMWVVNHDWFIYFWNRQCHYVCALNNTAEKNNNYVTHNYLSLCCFFLLCCNIISFLECLFITLSNTDCVPDFKIAWCSLWRGWNCSPVNH